jgi:phosphate transport system permease protein
VNAHPVKGPRAKAGRIAGDTPWVWLNAAAVSACILLALGLLMLIATRGLGHFWPAKVHEFTVLDEHGERTRLVGQVRERETVPMERLGDLAATLEGESGFVTRVLVKSGNRELTGQDFRWVVEERILQQATPSSMAVLEREEWGVFFGTVTGLKTNGVLLRSRDVWGDFQHMLDQSRQLRDEIHDLQRREAGNINYRLEQLRLKERGLQLDGVVDKEPFEAIELERQQLQSGYEQLEARLTGLNEAMLQHSVVVRTGGGPESDLDLPLAGILDAWQPNAMSLAAQLQHFFRQLWSFVTKDPREANTEGGIFPAIYGTVLMVLLMTVFVTPMGVIAGVYLKEYARQGLLTKIIRISVNNLAGVPSIVYGVFGLGFFVYTLGGSLDQVFFREALPSPTFGTGGLFWASLTLALLTLPTVIVATEEGLARIPRSLREGSLALGATQWETLWRTILPIASPGIITGVILAVARAAGEVAPLMLVGVVKLAPELPLDANYPFIHLDRKFMHMGFHIYDVGFQSPNVEAARPLVFATALVLVLVILLLNIAAVGARNRLREKFRGLET